MHRLKPYLPAPLVLYGHTMEARSGNGHHAELGKVRDDIRKVVQDSSILLKQSVQEVSGKARVAFTKADEAIHEKPFHTIGAAFGLGLLGGVLLWGLFGGSKKRDE